MLVTNDDNEVVGVVTRKDLASIMLVTYLILRHAAWILLNMPRCLHQTWHLI